MMRVHKLVSSSLGIGYIGIGGGTLAAVIACLCLYGVHLAAGEMFVIWLPFIAFLITGLGIWSAQQVESHWGKDDKKVVIDEVAGMCISLLFLPVTWEILLAGLVLFRFFDIVKPLYISKLEKLEGGWGVMLDDVVAGIYTNLLLHLFMFLNLL